MSETTWTKGPWLVDPENSTGVIAQHEIDTPDSGGICCCNATFWQRPLSECIANAHLIAAAPELYEVLAPFADALKGNWSHQPDDMEIVLGPHASDLRMKVTLGNLRRARSALKKARGEWE